MPHRIRCHCRGNPRCALCRGEKFYAYTPGERGWMPFGCPTCKGTRSLPGPDDTREPCFTCRAAGFVDPAKPPFPEGWLGHLHMLFGTLLGGG